MKKLGKKVSFLTKILLVFGLLISNLSSLSVVFAYEVSEDLTVTLNEEMLEINYTEELAEEVEAVKVKIYEKYTYLGGLSEKVEEDYSLSAEQLLAAKEGQLELSYNSMFVTDEVKNYELFDGTYSVEVEIVDVTDYSSESSVPGENTIETTALENEMLQTIDTEEETETVIAFSKYEKVIEYKSGLDIKLYNSNGEEITLVNGKYPVSLEDTNVRVVAHVLAGGLNPTDVFEYDGVEYLAKDLLAYEFKAEKNFGEYLYGEYTLPVEVKLLKPLATNETENASEVMLAEENLDSQYEEVVYTDNVDIMYGEYEENANVLNDALVTEELDELYLFVSDSKDGIMYSLAEFNEDGEELHVKSMLDLYEVVTSAIGENESITFKLFKNDADVFEGYDEVTQTKEEYLSSIPVDDTVVLSLSSNGLTITYRVVSVADLNNDNALTQEDVLSLIDQVIEIDKVEDLEKADVLVDGELNIMDVLYLKEIVKSKSWDALINKEDATLDASLNLLLGENESLVSGDEFVLEYVLSLEQLEEVSGFSGLFEYDKTALELLSIEGLTDWLGNYNKENGKILYYGEESLVGPEEVVSENEGTTEENSNESAIATIEEVEVTEEYVLLTVKFRALKAGTHSVKVMNNEFINDNTYLELTEELVVSTDVNVIQSDDNTLSYLEVTGQEIALVEDQFDYEITVSNDVTLVDLKYIVTNVAAKVTSTVYPEELVEGNNTVVVTVTSESGINQDYTITVIREEAKKEETTTQVSNNYYGNYEKEEGEVIVTPGDNDADEPIIKDEEESNLSRIVIIVLILLVIAGLVYLIFRDEDEEAKKVNKDINKLKKESIDATVKNKTAKTTADVSQKKENKTLDKKSSGSKNKKNNNKKKER